MVPILVPCTNEIHNLTAHIFMESALSKDIWDSLLQIKAVTGILELIASLYEQKSFVDRPIQKIVADDL